MLERLTGRLGRVHPNHKRIAGGAIRVGLFVFAAKFCVALREMAIAWKHGTSTVVDAYQLALTITTWLPMMLAATAGVVLVPKLVALRRDENAYRRLITELNGTVLLVGLAVMMLTWAAASRAVGLIGGGLTPAAAELTRSFTVEIAPVAFFMIVAGYLSSRLQARERYAYSLVEALPALVIAASVLAPVDMGPTAPLVWGTLLGYLLQTFWLGRMTHANDRPFGAIILRRQSPEWRFLYMPIVIMLAGQLVITMSNPLDQGFAAFLGEGAVATLGYANRIVGLVNGIGSVVVARALLPVLSGVVVDGDHRLGRSQTFRWSLLLIAIGALLLALGWVLAPVAVRLIFERGAFTAHDTVAVAHVLRFGLLQMPFFFGGLVLVQWFAASGRYDLLLKIAVVSIAVKIGMNFLLIDAYGLAGLMAATAAMYAVSFAVQIFVIGQHEKFS